MQVLASGTPAPVTTHTEPGGKAGSEESVALQVLECMLPLRPGLPPRHARLWLELGPPSGMPPPPPHAAAAAAPAPAAAVGAAGAAAAGGAALPEPLQRVMAALSGGRAATASGAANAADASPVVEHGAASS